MPAKTSSEFPDGRWTTPSRQPETKGFKAVSLGVNLKGHRPTRVEKIVNNNVVGMIEGDELKLRA